MRNISQLISPDDGMYADNKAHYFGVGKSALSNILGALAVTRTRPSRILDFGCGAGRVTRWLCAAFADAAVEACDIREADLAFVARELGAQTWRSNPDVDALRAPSTYDLIWVGSVFTHLDKATSVKLFDRLVSWLNPNGVLVFTSHGRRAASMGSADVRFYGVPDHWDRVLNDFLRSEFGYADYAHTRGYGISLVQLYWWAGLVTTRPCVRLIAMSEHSWDDHQDVLAVQRANLIGGMS